MKPNTFIFLLCATFIVCLPIILNPSLYLSRNNDLSEFFYPLIQYTKINIKIYHTFPLWNSSMLSGLPLVSDPQSPLFYLPNLLFLILPIQEGFVVSLVFHIFMSSIGMYMLAFYLTKDKTSSIFASLLYILNPRLFAYIEAGHVGLINSWAWVPFLLLATLKLGKAPNSKYILLFAVSQYLLFFSHTLTAFIALVVCILVFCVVCLSKASFKNYLYFINAVILSLCFSAVGLIPQFDWSQSTTRLLLLTNPDVYPKWESVVDFIKTVVFPWGNNYSNLWRLDTEKWVALGIAVPVLAFLSWTKLSRFYKLAVFAVYLSITIVSLNNASPIYAVLIKLPLYALLRVSTRFWFIAVVGIILLASLAIKNIRKGRTIIISLTLLESILLSFTYLSKSIPEKQFAPNEVYEYLSQDNGLYRVFCITRCLSQTKAIDKKLQLIEGYATLIQKNYYQHSWQLMGGYWNYYTLSLPPMGTKFDELQPSAMSLGEYNTKYVVTPYKLTDLKFVEEKKIGNYYIYSNENFFPRSYYLVSATPTSHEAPILFYSPNKIVIDTSDKISTDLVISEVFSEGWQAYLDDKQETTIEQSPSVLRVVHLLPETKTVTLLYSPNSYKTGLVLSAIGLGYSILLLLVNRKTFPLKRKFKNI